MAVYTPNSNLVMYVVYRSPGPEAGQHDGETAPASFLSLTDSAARERYEAVHKAVIDSGAIVVGAFPQGGDGGEPGHDRVPPGHDQPFPGEHQPGHGEEAIELTRKYTVTFGGARPVIVATLYARRTSPPDLLASSWRSASTRPGRSASWWKRGPSPPRRRTS